MSTRMNIWTKVGGEGDYRGARGVYARIVPIVDVTVQVLNIT